MNSVGQTCKTADDKDGGNTMKEMSACWSCSVLIEHGAPVCPLCAADQTNKPQDIDKESATRTLPAVFRELGLVMLVLAAGIAGIALILMHNLSAGSPNPTEQSAEVAANSLRDIREALSSAALSENAYPLRLESLGVRVAQPSEDALVAGYHLRYTQRTLPGGAAGFVIQAIPEKPDRLNLYIDESGIVRATSENRPASVQDAAWWQ
ncbi:MAG: hypothetical protein WBL63_20500 [Candidatus Acidiferrum sp.]